jgi:L-glyceraldehyde 3-phosphate reductase
LNLSPITLGLMTRDCSPRAGFDSVRQTILRAVDRGITSIDLATGYGGGAVETAFGKVLRSDLEAHRKNLVVATKGAWAEGSERAIVDTLDKSLHQLGVDHVDLFYHHAPDANTPPEVTAAAMAKLVRDGKTRHVGISNYSVAQTIRMVAALREAGVACVAHQANYNMLNRWVEDGLIQALEGLDMSLIAYSTVAMGLLSDACADNGPREGSRASKMLAGMLAGLAEGEPAYGKYPEGVNPRAHILSMLRSLRAIAQERRQTLAQLAIAWTLRHPQVATALVGMSNIDQVDAGIETTEHLDFSDAERARIASILPPRWGLR